jgi:hypothetical protein
VAEKQKKRGAIRVVFWAVCSILMFYFVAHSYTSGQMTRWYYYRTGLDGYAVNVHSFNSATKEKPAILEISPQAKEIKGLMAVPVKKGDRLPEYANGVISKKLVDEAKRAKVEGNQLKVMVPWQIQESKGFKYKDTFLHKGIETYAWSGVWNVAVVIALGFCLGLMAEGFTDFMGWKIQKIVHFEKS